MDGERLSGEAKEIQLIKLKSVSKNQLKFYLVSIYPSLSGWMRDIQKNMILN